MLSTVLGVTYGRGNTVEEIVRSLEQSQKADGTAPGGTIYFMTNNDDRTTPRRPGFPMAVDQLKLLNVQAAILPEAMPKNRPDVQGLVSGVAEFDWNATNSTILPGAICENLTSYGGVFTATATQTPLSVFLRHGAAGSSGTVTEPFAIQNKFPHAMIQVHYARGCSLAESFYQALYAPYQLIIVGDPLCQPWANIPEITVGGAKSGDTLTGKVMLRATAKLSHMDSVDRFEFFVDGQRLAVFSADEPMELNTREFTDGDHELRVVGIENSPIESQGRAIIPVRFSNYGKTIQFEVSPVGEVQLGQKIKLHAQALGSRRGIAFYHNKELIAQFEGDRGETSVDSTVLGAGPISLFAIGWGQSGGGIDTAVVSAPVQLTIKKQPPQKLH